MAKSIKANPIEVASIDVAMVARPEERAKADLGGGLVPTCA
jgi:hypothetical protein